MKIILTDLTEIKVNEIIPSGEGLVINTTAKQVSEIEQYITNTNIDTITCMEGDTVFARYCNQQLDSLVKDGEGIHIHTKYKTLAADADVSKQLSDLQNTIMSMQSIQDIQNAAIAEIGGLVSQSMTETADTNNNGEEATEDDTVLRADDNDKKDDY